MIIHTVTSLNGVACTGGCVQGMACDTTCTDIGSGGSGVASPQDNITGNDMFSMGRWIGTVTSPELPSTSYLKLLFYLITFGLLGAGLTKQIVFKKL